MKSSLLRERIKDSLLKIKKNEKTEELQPSSPLLLPVIETISTLAQILADEKQGPTDLLRALAQNHLFQLMPLAAERHYHATLQNNLDEIQKLLIDISPLIELEPKKILAAPVGPMTRESLQHFEDKILTKLLSTKKKKLILSLSFLKADKKELSDWLLNLKQELSAQSVKTEIMK
jgi:hypothetical protein